MTAAALTVSRDIAHYLEIAPSLVQRVADAADTIDADRQIPTDLAADMADAGFFRLLLPEEMGGAELAHPDFLRILEMFAAADASVAWCLNQNNVFSTRSTRMTMSTAEEIWGELRGVVTNGPPAAGSKSGPVSTAATGSAATGTSAAVATTPRGSPPWLRSSPTTGREPTGGPRRCASTSCPSTRCAW